MLKLLGFGSMGGQGYALRRRLTQLVPRGARKAVQQRMPRSFVRWYVRPPVDVFMLSFPKAGRTWLRMMMGKALTDHFGIDDDAGLIKLERLTDHNAAIPRIVATHDDVLLKQADEVADGIGKYTGRRVILLVRDPRDVIVSLYHHRRGREMHYEGSLDEFLREPVGSFDTLLAFYDAWAAQLDDRAAADLVHVMRYEDMHADPAREVRGALDFVGISVPRALVDNAIEFGSFDNMRRLEETSTIDSDKLQPGEVGNYDTYKTRKGKVGSFSEELTSTQIDDLNRRISTSQANRFGYKP